MKVVFDFHRQAPEDEECLSDELERVAAMIRDGFTSGELDGGWWTIEGDFAP
ncbi:MAG: hypothetical protein AB7J28_15880 [Hyphomonadaceae bacterium]